MQHGLVRDLNVSVDGHSVSRATFPASFFSAQETRELLEKYAGAIDYRDVDLDHVEGAGLDSIATLAELTAM